MRKEFKNPINQKTKIRIVEMALAILLAGCLLCGCSDQTTAGSKEPPQSTDETDRRTGSTKDGQEGKVNAWEDDEEAEILLVFRRSNYAWGFYDNGYVIDTKGRFHSYDNGCPRPLDGDESGDILSLANYLEVILENDQGVQVFDKEFVEEISKLGADLAPEDEFSSEHKMCDYGQETIYYFNPETRKLMQCQSTGDVDQMPKYKSAAKIVKLLEKALKKYSKPAKDTDVIPDVSRVYSLGECFETEFEMNILNDWAGKWIVKNSDDLNTFADISGIWVNYILEKMKNARMENYVFFITIEDASKDKQVPKAFWVSGECCGFVYDKEKEAAADHFVCRVAAVNGSVLPEELISIRDLDGQAWAVFNEGTASREMPIEDYLTIEYAKDEEFVVMRVGEEYLLLPGGSRRVFLGDCAEDLQMEDGQILRIVVDGEIYNGGEVGYMRDVFLKKVKETTNVTYQEAIEKMAFPGTEGARFWWGEHVVKYCEGDHVFLVVLNHEYVYAYLDGELALRYEFDEREGILTPFFDFLETCSGDVEFSQE